ncbi:MAG TPA: EI24 domain-containing protein [Kofleriaceae bacterium]|jgi:CysZ protein
MREMSRGFSDLGRALGFLKVHPRVWRWLIAPAIVSLVLLTLIVLGIGRASAPMATWASSHVPHVLAGVVHWLVSAIVIVGLGVAAALLFVAVVGLISGPFCEKLSEEVEEELTGIKSPPFVFSRFIGELLVSIGHALRRLLMSFVWIVGLFLLNFVPGIGTLASVAIGAYLAARGTAYDCYDAVMGRRGMTYDQKWTYLERTQGRALGLGAAVTALMFVPVVNLFALGIGAVAATLADHEVNGSAASRGPLQAPHP